MEKETMNKNKQEAGNVLFLILIAVALFAALSYAVTQSSRGGGNADSETALIGASTVTQYPASLSTSVLRMSISGTAAEDVDFTTPANAATDLTDAADEALNLFHADGGGASYQTAPTSVMAGGVAGTWVFNGENQIAQIGTTDTDGTVSDTSAIDIIAFLPGVTEGVCEAINDQLGIPDVPTETGIDFATQKVSTTGTQMGLCDSGCGGDIGDATGGGHDLDGQPFGCFDQGGTNVYYHVLSER